MYSKTSNRNLIIFFGVLILTSIFLVGVPIFPVMVKEAYEVSVPYTVEEEYIEMEEKTQVLVDQTSDLEIQGGHYKIIEEVIEEGTQITFTFQASQKLSGRHSDLYVYIFNSDQYLAWNTLGSEVALEKISGTSGTLSHNCLIRDKYYFVFSNDHPHSVFLNSAKITLQWDEPITKYRTVTEYRNEIQHRDVIKRVTFVSWLLKTY